MSNRTPIEDAWNWANQIVQRGLHKRRALATKIGQCKRCGAYLGLGLSFTPQARNELFAWIFEGSISGDRMKILQVELEAIAHARERVAGMVAAGKLEATKAEWYLRRELNGAGVG